MKIANDQVIFEVVIKQNLHAFLDISDKQRLNNMYIIRVNMLPCPTASARILMINSASFKAE